jgi:hypothetical protein
VKRMIEIRLENTAHTAVQNVLAAAGGAAAAAFQSQDRECLARGASADAGPLAPCCYCGWFEPRKTGSVRSCPLCQEPYHEECRTLTRDLLLPAPERSAETLIVPTSLGLSAEQDFCCICRHRLSFADAESQESEGEEEKPVVSQSEDDDVFGRGKDARAPGEPKGSGSKPSNPDAAKGSEGPADAAKGSDDCDEEYGPGQIASFVQPRLERATRIWEF